MQRDVLRGTHAALRVINLLGGTASPWPFRRKGGRIARIGYPLRVQTSICGINESVATYQNGSALSRQEARIERRLILQPIHSGTGRSSAEIQKAEEIRESGPHKSDTKSLLGTSGLPLLALCRSRHRESV